MGDAYRAFWDASRQQSPLGRESFVDQIARSPLGCRNSAMEMSFLWCIPARCAPPSPLRWISPLKMRCDLRYRSAVADPESTGCAAGWRIGAVNQRIVPRG